MQTTHLTIAAGYGTRIVPSAEGERWAREWTPAFIDVSSVKCLQRARRKRGIFQYGYDVNRIRNGFRF